MTTRGLIAECVIVVSSLTSFAEVDCRRPIQDSASIQLGIVQGLALGNRRTNCRSSFEDLNTSCISLTFGSVLQTHVVCESVDDAAVRGRDCAREDQSLLSFSVFKQHKLIIISESRRIIQINFYFC
jgi:hypothetical protein